MKRQFKSKHQGSSTTSEDRGGDTTEKQEEPAAGDPHTDPLSPEERNSHLFDSIEMKQSTEDQEAENSESDDVSSSSQTILNPQSAPDNPVCSEPPPPSSYHFPRACSPPVTPDLSDVGHQGVPSAEIEPYLQTLGQQHQTTWEMFNYCDFPEFFSHTRVPASEDTERSRQEETELREINTWSQLSDFDEMSDSECERLMMYDELHKDDKSSLSRSSRLHHYRKLSLMSSQRSQDRPSFPMDQDPVSDHHRSSPIIRFKLRQLRSLRRKPKVQRVLPLSTSELSPHKLPKSVSSRFPVDVDEIKDRETVSQSTSCSPSIITAADAPSPQQSSEDQFTDVLTSELSSDQFEDEAAVQLQEETESRVTAELTSCLQVHNTDSSETREPSRPPPRSLSVPCLSPAPRAQTRILTRSQSLPALKLPSSFEEFTPDVSTDEDQETYRFQCSSPGLYQCTVTGLVFHMEGGGDVVYRTVPWNRRLLSPHRVKPAGPLFDIRSVQQCVCQLHLPHCELLSTGGSHFLSVAHVSDEGVELIRPQRITHTHVVINITGFSAYGNVKDEDSPPDPVRALVLLFYRPPDDPECESLINVLLLPKNVSLWDVQRSRKTLVGDERYMETSPHCKLKPDQLYSLSTCPQDDSFYVQPTQAEFDADSYDNFFPTFQVTWESRLKHLKLILRDVDSSLSVWERRVCLTSTGQKKCCGPSAANAAPSERLLGVRSGFIDGISQPVLKSLLDKLLEKKVMSDSERESVDETENKRDKARCVIDTVRKKGEAASSEMMELLCELDPFLCQHLDLM